MEDVEDREGQLEAGLHELSLEEGQLDDTNSSELLRDPSRFYNLQVGLGSVPNLTAQSNQKFEILDITTRENLNTGNVVSDYKIPNCYNSIFSALT